MIRGRPRGRLSKTTQLNESVFDTITEESSYWIGFMMADGCVNFPPGGRSPRLSLGLAPRDGAHVQTFAQFLETNHPVKLRGHLVQLQCVSPQLVTALQKYGVEPRKSKNAQVVGLSSNRDFWRGVFDGDGSIMWTKPDPKNNTYKSYPRIRLVGSLPLLSQFRNFVGLGVVKPHGSIWALTVTGNKAVCVITQLYKGCGIALPRKLQLANTIIGLGLGSQELVGQGLSPQDSRVVVKP